MAEAAEVIVNEARDILQKDLGMKIDWNSPEEVQKSSSLISSLQGNNYKLNDITKFRFGIASCSIFMLRLKLIYVRF